MDSVHSAATAILDLVEGFPRQDGHGLRIAMDGPSGSGKSTIAFAVAAQLEEAFVLQTDTFHFPLSVANQLRSVREYGAMIDWRRYRETVLRKHTRGEPVHIEWIHPVTGLLSAEHHVAPFTTLLCDGTFSARPELRDLYDIRVLVDADESVRKIRTMRRDANMGDEWSAYLRAVWEPHESSYMTWAATQAYDLRLNTSDWSL